MKMLKIILKKLDGHVKTALVMIKTGVDAEEAKGRLEKAEGFVRKAIDIEKLVKFDYFSLFLLGSQIEPFWHFKQTFFPLSP